MSFADAACRIQNGTVNEVRDFLMAHPDVLHSIDPDECGTLLFVAVRAQRQEMVELLWELGFNMIDAKTRWGCTIFHDLANVEMMVYVVKWLIDTYPSDLTWAQIQGRLRPLMDCREALGITPMFHAAASIRTDMVAMLLQLGSEAMNIPDADGYTPLHAAATTEDIELVQLCLRYSADVDAKTIDGTTPLNQFHIGSPEIIRLLRCVGAQVSMSDEELGNMGSTYRTAFTEPISDDDIIACRYQIYFDRSLLERLLECACSPF